MASFDDVRRIVNTPPADQLVPFQHDSLLPDVFIEPGDRTLSMQDIYTGEIRRARLGDKIGQWSVALGVTSGIVGVLGAAVQSDAHKMVEGGKTMPTDLNLYSWLAETPLDWKALAAAGTTFAVTSGARRASRIYTVPVDMRKTMQEAQEADQFAAHTEKSYRAFRRRRAVRETAITLASTGVAYAAGNSLDIQQTLYATTGIMAATFGRLAQAKYRYNSLKNRALGAK